MQSIKKKFHYIKWLIWKLSNPNKNYGEFYSEFIAKRSEYGHKHPTLSNELIDPEYFRNSGEKRLNFLKSRGLIETSRFIDYGFGTLRSGIVIIPYLNSHNYWGVDITDKFFDIAKSRLSQDVLTKKFPRFDKINNKTLLKLKEFNADFLFSDAVAYHIPPFEICDYIENIKTAMSEKTQSYISIRLSRYNSQESLMRWSYSEDYISQIIKKNKLKLDIINDPIQEAKNTNNTRDVFLILKNS